MKKIVIIGQSIERSKGGIASIIKAFIDGNSNNYEFKFEHFVSHVEGSIFERLSIFIKCYLNLLVTSNIALAHIHTACYGSFYRKALFALLCRIKNIPVIMHIHGADFDRFYLKSSFITKKFIKKTLKNCTRVIVLSNYWKIFFQDTMSLNNIEVLYNSVNCDSFNFCCTIPKNITSFLFLGRLGERKGIYDLVKAIDILINIEGLRNLKFYFAGDGEIDEVKKIVEKLKLNENIDILGWINNEIKAEVFLKADTVILPSYNEGLPVALLEAMSAGKIILSTYVGGIPDLVTEGVNGYLFNPGDINTLVLMIKHIIQNPDTMEIISNNNIEKIRKEYNFTNINKQLFQLYIQILS